MDQGSVRRGSKYFYHRYLSGFLDRSDPRSNRDIDPYQLRDGVGSGISHRHSSHIDTIAGIHSRTLIPDPMLMIVAEFYIGSGISTTLSFVT